MISRRFLVLVALLATGAACFLIGDFHARAGDGLEWAAYDAKLDAIRAEVRSQLGRGRAGEDRPEGTIGSVNEARPGGAFAPSPAERAQMVQQIKREQIGRASCRERV